MCTDGRVFMRWVGTMSGLRYRFYISLDINMNKFTSCDTTVMIEVSSITQYVWFMNCMSLGLIVLTCWDGRVCGYLW